MNKTYFRKSEPEHRLRPLDSKPKDRGDHTTRNVAKITKTKTHIDPKVKPEMEHFIDCLRNQVVTSHDTTRNAVNERNNTYRSDEDKTPHKDKKTNVGKVKILKHTRMATQNEYGVRLSEKNLRKIHEKMIKVVEPLDIVKRRRLYRMYTFRKPGGDNNINNEEKKDDSTETDSPVLSCQEFKHHPATERERVHPDLTRPHSAKGASQKPLPTHRFETSTVRPKRKPIIKTVSTPERGSARTYKSVSFSIVEQNKTPRVGRKAAGTSKTRTQSKPKAPPSSVNSPSSHSQKSKRSLSHTSTSSKVAHRTSPSRIQKLVMNRSSKCRSRRLRRTSPETASRPQPITEMAKWAPQSVTDHTKPYYEAWVSTTPAAISNDSDQMRREKELIVQQMEMKRQYQAELSENDLTDEKYTGRIVIHR